MITQSDDSTSTKATREKTSAIDSSTPSGGENQTISPVKRWLLIRESAYLRAQKRGFVGGNPLEDWTEAEEEIDAQYKTNFQSVFSLTDPAEITEQFKSVLAVYGLDHLSVDAFLKKHRDGMSKLAAFNRELIDSTSKLAGQQTTVVQNALTEAANSLQAVAKGKVNMDGVTKQADLAIDALENALSHFKALTESVVGMSSTTRQKRKDNN